MEKKDKLMIFTFASLALSLVSTITYMIYTIVSNGSFINHVVSTIGVIILVVVAVFLVVTGFFIENKKAKVFIIIVSLLLSIYSITQIIIGIIELLPDFTNYDIKEVVNWTKDRNIKLEKEYDYDDKIEKYHIIKQNYSKGTNIKNIDSLKVTISNGIDPNKTTIIDNMVGWKLDDVIKVIDDNKLTNVTINFEFSNTVEKDTIISQDVISEVTRNEPIKLVSSLGRQSNQKSVVMENLVGLDLFHAKVYLGRNNIKYSIIYAYDEDKEDVVLKQSIKQYEVISPNKKYDEMVITVAKQGEITIPNLNDMSISQIDYWALNNKVIIDYEEKYDDTIKENKVISFNNKAGNIITPGSRIEVTISKGILKMIEFTSVADFEEWAKEENVSYNIEYEYSSTVEQGKVIRSSHKKNDIIKNDDMVNITISQGSKTIIPNLIGKTVSEAKLLCEQANIICRFKYNDNNAIVTKQSMRANSQVPSGTTIDVE